MLILLLSFYSNTVRTDARCDFAERGLLTDDVLRSQKGAPSFLPPQMPSTPVPSGATPASGAAGAADMILAKRAEIQAKLAAMRKMAPGGGLNTASPPPPSSAPPPPPPSSSGLPAVPGLPKPNLDPDLAKKVADAKRLVESMQAKKRAAMQPQNPYLVSCRGARCPYRV